MCGLCRSQQFTPGCDATLTLELTVETAPGATAEAADHRPPPLPLTVDHAAGRYPVALQVAAAAPHAFQVSIKVEGALEAPRALNQRPVEGRGQIDDAIPVWGAATHRPAFALIGTPSPGAQSALRAPLEATITSLGGQSAPADEQHSMPRIQWGPVTRVAELALPLLRTGRRSVRTWPRRVPAGVLVVAFALLLFLLMITSDSITALTVVPLWVVLPPLVLLLLLLVFAQHGRLMVRTAVPVWTLLVPVTLLLLLLGLARTSTPPSPAPQAATPLIIGPLRFGHVTPLHPSPVARPQVVKRVLDSGTGRGSATYGATAHTSHAPAPTATAPGTIVIHNSPRTAVVGQAERFSVLLSGQPHTWLTYILHYPDGHEDRILVRTDDHGYASYSFRVSPYQARRFRATGTVGVADATGRVLASTHVAIQQP